MIFFFLDVSVIYSYAVVSDRKGNIMLQKLYVFFRKETVLSIAVILALLSMFWVRPDKAYFTYIDQAPLLFDGNCSWFEGCWCF